MPIMKTLSISDVRNRLPAVIDDVVQSNETVVVTRYGKPVASIVPFKGKRSRETRYPLRGHPITVADDFDRPTPELWRAVAEEQGEYAADRPRRPGMAGRVGYHE